MLSILWFGLASSLTLQAQAAVLTLDDVLQKTINSSYELKIAQVDIQINRKDIKAARSEYFPTIRANMNTEYLRDLENQFRPVTAVGNTVIPAGTRYQNSVGVNMNQSLIDFGSRKRKVDIAKHSVAAKSAEYFQTLRDVRLKLIDLYTEALISYKAIKANESLLQLAQQGYQLKKRLYKAGTTSNVDVAEEAIQVAQTLDNIQVHKDELRQHLKKLSYFTHESYNMDDVEMADLQDEPSPEAIEFKTENAPESRMYDALISRKQSEIEYLKRQYLPQVALYSAYNMYGFDPESWKASVENISQRTISLGLSINLPIFDGLKTQAAIEKAKLEKEKLVLQKAEKLEQLQYQANLYNTQIEGFSIQLQTKARILNKTQDKLTMVNRLSEKKVVDQTQAIREHMERVRKQMEVEKSLIQGVSALKKLKIMAEG